ncbi:hypothetical protein DEU39_3613 [Chryseobacterium sp. AG363]|nr:hypothetical protein DEU39_3613 [Chryseobacterium sp. AG363]
MPHDAILAVAGNSFNYTICLVGSNHIEFRHS